MTNHELYSVATSLVEEAHEKLLQAYGRPFSISLCLPSAGADIAVSLKRTERAMQAVAADAITMRRECARMAERVSAEKESAA